MRAALVSLAAALTLAGCSFELDSDGLAYEDVSSCNGGWFDWFGQTAHGQRGELSYETSVECSSFCSASDSFAPGTEATIAIQPADQIAVLESTDPRVLRIESSEVVAGNEGCADTLRVNIQAGEVGDADLVAYAERGWVVDRLTIRVREPASVQLYIALPGQDEEDVVQFEVGQSALAVAYLFDDEENRMCATARVAWWTDEDEPGSILGLETGCDAAAVSGVDEGRSRLGIEVLDFTDIVHVVVDPASE